MLGQDWVSAVRYIVSVFIHTLCENLVLSALGAWMEAERWGISDRRAWKYASDFKSTSQSADTRLTERKLGSCDVLTNSWSNYLTSN